MMLLCFLMRIIIQMGTVKLILRHHFLQLLIDLLFQIQRNTAVFRIHADLQKACFHISGKLFIVQQHPKCCIQLHSLQLQLSQNVVRILIVGSDPHHPLLFIQLPFHTWIDIQSHIAVYCQSRGRSRCRRSLHQPPGLKQNNQKAGDTQRESCCHTGSFLSASLLHDVVKGFLFDFITGMNAVKLIENHQAHLPVFHAALPCLFSARYGLYFHFFL